MTKNDNCLKKLNSDAIHCALSYLFSKIEENRNYKIIKVIFNVVELSKLNENMLQKNLRIAAKKGYHRIIENIVNKNEQFFNYIMEIFIDAAEKGNIDVVNTILRNKKFFDCIIKILKGNKDAVKKILKNEELFNKLYSKNIITHVMDYALYYLFLMIGAGEGSC